jgi:transcriptional regulator with XRE-family HTH domain
MIGERVRMLRGKYRWSQQELADKVNVKQAYISKIELDEREPSHDILKGLAIALKTTISYLIGETGDPQINSLVGSAGNRWRAIAVASGGREAGEVEVDSNLAPLKPHHQALIRVLPKAFSASCGWGNDWSWNSEAIAFEFEQTDPDPELARYSPLIGMYVTGDSMEPDIFDGDMVIFTDNPSEIEYAPTGSIVVVNYEGRMIVRGIFRKEDTVILRAWNSIYKDIVANPESDFKICGLVLKIYPGPKKPRSML